MNIGVLKELVTGENRVAMVPEVAKKLIRQGFSIAVEAGSGDSAGYSDQDFISSGASVLHDYREIVASAKILLRIHGPQLRDNSSEIVQFNKDSIYIAFLNPIENYLDLQAFARADVTSFAMERVPRISRAQSMDALSSQANIAGYKAALFVAGKHQKMLPMFITAAGTIKPAKALVIGAGVAGLQAIATLKRLGAQVFGFDVRSAVKEQIESLGARFVDISLKTSLDGIGGYAKSADEETEKTIQNGLEKFVSDMDIVISTAQIPGKKAPLLITKEAIKNMGPGSIILDMAAASGGNVDGIIADERVVIDGVQIFAPTNLPSSLAYDASHMYANNIANFLALMVKDGKINFDWNDEILAKSCMTHDGKVVR